MRIHLLIISSLIAGTLSAQDMNTDTTRSESRPVILLQNSYEDFFQNKFDFSFKQASLTVQNRNSIIDPAMSGFMHGMFCSAEYKMERKMKLAPRFRLGSVNYANWMEGKGEYYRRYWK